VKVCVHISFKCGIAVNSINLSMKCVFVTFLNCTLQFWTRNLKSVV